MRVNKNNKKISSSLNLFHRLLSCFLLCICQPALAELTPFSLEKISPQTATSAKGQWLQVINAPNDLQQYYVSTSQGKILRINTNNQQNQPLVFDLAHQNQSATPAKKTLTAFTLHPNFNLREQQGFGVFYTAHIENYDVKSKTKRLRDRSAKFSRHYDAVVTEWRLKRSTKSVDYKSQREVMRIALPKNTQGINQLGFNPYLKSWNDDFGLLHISLSGSELLKNKPLYSGVILRINPNKYGLRSFSIASSNPFLSNDAIDDAIYLLGAQQIKQFIWPDKNKAQLLISHQYGDKNSGLHLLSQANKASDWRDIAPKNVIYRSNTPVASMLVYRGRNTANFRDKLIFLTQQKQHWQLKSLPSKSALAAKQNNALPVAQLEWQIDSLNAAITSLQLSQNADNDVLLFSANSGEIFQLFQNTSNKEKTPQEPSSPVGLYVFLTIIAIIGLGYLSYQLRVKKHSSKALVRRQYGRITLDEANNQLKLYKRHQKESSVHIDLHNIASCQILLGDNVLALIDTHKGFNDEAEDSLRSDFKNEHTIKMIEGKVRRISLFLVDNNKHNYMTCLYLRKGNDRITKKSYFAVIDDLIDWCWIISANINANNTGKRKHTPKLTPAEIALSQHKVQDETPLHKQAAAIRPSSHSFDTDLYESDDITQSTPQRSPALNDDEHTQNTGAIDTELVNALEKLANLQQQGILSAEEFAKAKAKLLKDLINE